MNTDMHLYPRLNRAAAERIWLDISGQSVSSLQLKVATKHRDQEFLESGGSRVEIPEIESIRSGLTTIIETLGFPLPLKDAARFDLEAAQVLYEKMSICPGEAARNEVWSFLTVVVLPDLARWRFPGSGKARFLGGVRNTFQRLWWRAHTLRDNADPDPYRFLRGLTEDAQVQIMERTNLSSNRTLARAVAEASLRLRDSLSPSEFENSHRSASKMLLQRMVIVNFDGLSPEDLTAAVSSIFSRFQSSSARGYKE